VQFPGAYSAFHQLAYDLRLPAEKSIIRQVIMWSNGPGVQPKSAIDAQKQFNELLSVLDIPYTLSSQEKISRLRSCSPQELIDAGTKLKRHQFRPYTDSVFIPTHLLRRIDDGWFGHQLEARRVRLMIGECRDEHFVYGSWYPPENDSLSSLRRRLEADYSPEICDALVELYYPTGQLPENCDNWRDAFGHLYADIQVHMLQRGFIDALTRGVSAASAAQLVHRYRIEYRVKCVDKMFPPAWGVTHATDLAMWFWGNGDILEDHEQGIVQNALIEPMKRFVQGGSLGADFQWNRNAARVSQAWRLRSDGHVDVWEDSMWDKGLRVWKVLRNEDSTLKINANL
jgi:carboxylesterase type B